MFGTFTSFFIRLSVKLSSGYQLAALMEARLSRRCQGHLSFFFSNGKQQFTLLCHWVVILKLRRKCCSVIFNAVKSFYEGRVNMQNAITVEPR